MAEPSFRPYDPDHDEIAVIDLITTESWAYRVQPVLTENDVRASIEKGDYAGDAVLTFLIEVDGAVIGLVRAEDVGNPRQDPQLDFRLRERVRGRGIGLTALRYITEEVFSRHPATVRIEGQTRRDNHPMRTVFRRGGYVLEAVYRQAWPDLGGVRHDGIGYALLRCDWESGATTPARGTDPGRATVSLRRSPPARAG